MASAIFWESVRGGGLGSRAEVPHDHPYELVALAHVPQFKRAVYEQIKHLHG